MFKGYLGIFQESLKILKDLQWNYLNPQSLLEDLKRTLQSIFEGPWNIFPWDYKLLHGKWFTWDKTRYLNRWLLSYFVSRNFFLKFKSQVFVSWECFQVQGQTLWSCHQVWSFRLLEVITWSWRHSQNSGVLLTGEYKSSRKEFGGANTLQNKASKHLKYSKMR